MPYKSTSTKKLLIATLISILAALTTYYAANYLPQFFCKTDASGECSFSTNIVVDLSASVVLVFFVFLSLVFFVIACTQYYKKTRSKNTLK